MGRWSYSNKDEADGLTKLSASFLNKHGYFKYGYRTGTITWTSKGMWGESKNSIGISSSIWEHERKMHLNYAITKRDSEKKTIDYDVPLETTACNYGGVRYWFICPFSRNGQYCGRRVGTLYLGNGDYFGCRHCYDLTYESKKENRHYKLFPLFDVMLAENKIEELRGKIKRPYYTGRPTKKQQRLERLYERAGKNFRLYVELDKRGLV